MTPTSEERRWVAAMLRIEVRDEDESLDYPVCRIISDILGVNGAWGAEAAHILADLIDPTCEVESVEPIRAGEFNQAIGSAFHLTCGHTAWRAYTDEPPVYCEECGARVVNHG